MHGHCVSSPHRSACPVNGLAPPCRLLLLNSCPTSRHIGAGVLGGVGGLVLLSCVAGIGFVLWRRHRRRTGPAVDHSKGAGSGELLVDDSARPTGVCLQSAWPHVVQPVVHGGLGSRVMSRGASGGGMRMVFLTRHSR